MQRERHDTRRPTKSGHNRGGGLLVLADDLTGACDSGVAFLASGRRVRVVLDGARFGADGSLVSGANADAVLAFTTETRSMTQEQAAERVAQTMMPLLHATNGQILFKKIDSAGRGHIGAETLAALGASGATLALVAPAFPQTGRTVCNGVLEVRDSAGRYASVLLRELFPRVDAAQIDILPCGSEAETEDGIGRALARGIRVLLCDAQAQADLERLARAGYRAAESVLSILWTGSAGLAHALAGLLPAARPIEAIPPARRDGRTLVFVGTEHPVTVLQAAHLEGCRGAEAVIHRMQWSGGSSDTESGALRREVRAAFAAAPTAGLILTGGETAAFVLRALDASSILLAGEISRGIPWGLVEGGGADGCIVVTKSGGFGSRGALADAFDCCRRICNGEYV